MTGYFQKSEQETEVLRQTEREIKPKLMKRRKDIYQIVPGCAQNDTKFQFRKQNIYVYPFKLASYDEGSH